MNNKNDELKDILKSSDRYKGFTLLDNPVCFKDMFKGKVFDAVQLHFAQAIDIGEGKKDIVGFCGIFRWADGKITPLDGDTYYDDFNVLGFEEFNYEENSMKLKGIDVLVGNDW